VIHFRTFRNGDPPLLARLWNESLTGRGAVPLRGAALLEYFTFAKPYFDPAGLILAEDGGAPVGFVHAGFGPSADGSHIDDSVGVICALAVIPTHRSQGVGSELLRLAEGYLRDKGAKTIYAGSVDPRNPYLFGIYGGSRSPGFLDSDAAARPFLEGRGYRLAGTRQVYQCALDQPPTTADGRFAAFRQRYEIHVGPRRGLSWYQEAAVGPIELHEYRLMEKEGGRTVARASLWEMETFSQRWNEHAFGVAEVFVEPEVRRQGLAKFLLAQLLRHLHEQFFTLAEAQADVDDLPAVGLYKGLGFSVVDSGRSFVREGS
jgi:ribosomal protein S18 acetylase RimI-like enzyme